MAKAYGQELVDALRGLGADMKLFNDKDLQRLWDNGYKDSIWLLSASRKGLTSTGLSAALVDHLRGLQARDRTCSTSAAHGAGGSSRGAGAGAGTGGGAINDSTTAYLTEHVSPSTHDATLLNRSTSLLRSELTRQVGPGLPLPSVVGGQLLAACPPELHHHLAIVDMQQGATAPVALALHVYDVLHDAVKGPGGGCNTKTYVAIRMHKLLESTWWLIAGRLNAYWLTFNRNAVDPSGSTVTQLRPDFMVWVKRTLLFKGEERASEADMPEAMAALRHKMTEAWVTGTVRTRANVRAPCVLAYAAAGCFVQVFAIFTAEPQAAGGGGGRGQDVRMEAISPVLDVNKIGDRLTLLVATFNIWRLLAGYALTPDAPVPELPVGMTREFNSCSLTLFPGNPGFIRKEVTDFKSRVKPYTTFKVLRRMYKALSKPQHQTAIIQAVDGYPQLDKNGSYVVHLKPAGLPFRDLPSNEAELKRVVVAVLRGLAALHAEGFVHRDVRWQNVIYLEEQRRWLLIDLEHAGQAGCDCSQPPFPLRYWSDRTLEADGTYSKASDLRMVAEQLMASRGEPGNAPLRLPFTLSPEGQRLRQKLLQPGGKLSAAGALAHKWLQL